MFMVVGFALRLVKALIVMMVLLVGVTICWTFSLCLVCVGDRRGSRSQMRNASRMTNRALRTMF